MTETLPKNSKWLTSHPCSVESLLDIALQGKNPPADDIFK